MNLRASIISRLIASRILKHSSLLHSILLVSAVGFFMYSLGHFSGHIQFLAPFFIAWIVLSYFFQKLTLATLAIALILMPFEIGWGLPLTLAQIDPIGGFPQQFSVWLLVTYADVLIGILALVAFNRQRKFPLYFSPDVSLLVLIIWSLFTTLFSLNPVASLIGFFTLTKGVVVYFVITRLITRKTIPIIIGCLTITLLTQSLWALFQFSLGHPTGHFFELASQRLNNNLIEEINLFLYRPSGTFIDPNIFSLYIAMLLPLTLYGALYANSPLLKQSAAVASLISISAIAVSLSRTGWLIVLTLFTWIAIAERSTITKQLTSQFIRQRVKIIIVASFLLLSISFPRILWPRLTTLTEVFEEGGVIKARIDLIKESLVIITHHPLLGVGLNNFVPTMVENNATGLSQTFLSEVHNIYLLLTAELGFPGLIIFFFFLKTVFTLWIDHANKTSLVKAIFLGIVTYLFFGLSIPSLINGSYFPTFMTLVGLLIVMTRRHPGAIKNK